MRKQISPTHPVLQGRRILSDTDVLRGDDLSACVSMLLSPQGEEWVPVSVGDPGLIGKTVAYALSAEYGDMDRNDRIYTRSR